MPRSRVSDPRKFTRQVLNLPDERGYDAVGVLVGDLGEEHVTGLTLDQRCDVTVARAGNRIPLPVAGDGEVPCGGRTFADRACCAQTGRQLLLQNAPGPDEQASIGGLMGHACILIVGMPALQPARDLLR